MHRCRRTSCAGIRCRCPIRRRISSMGWCRWPATARRDTHVGLRDLSLRRQSVDARSLFLQRRRRMADRAPIGDAHARHRTRPHRGSNRRKSRSFPAACAFASTSRRLRRAATSARISARPFKLPDLGPIGSNGLANPARFFDSSGALRRPSTGRHELIAKISRAPVDRADGSFAARCGRLARQQRARINTTCAASMRSVRFPMTIPILPYSWCCTRRATPPAPATSISSCFRRVGSRWQIPSGRPGSIATWRANTWV